MGGMCRIWEVKNGKKKTVVEELQGKRLHGRSRHIWEDNIYNGS
jgi:hypothetical protein